MSGFEQRYPSEHAPNDVWQAINTPLSRELGHIVNPGLIVNYEDIGEAGQIQLGTRITYVPDGSMLERVPQMARRLVPEDITLRVAEQDHEDKTRVDVLESRKAQGSVRRKVETAEDGSGLLVVEAELSINSIENMLKIVFENMFGSTPEDMLIRYGIDEPSRHTLENLPRIIE